VSSYLRVLRFEDFRFLFFGQAASMVGDRVVVVALALFVTARSSSPAALGLILAAQSLTLVGLLLVGGVWADRLPRQRIMISADIVRGLLHAGLAVLIFTDAVQIWELVVIEALFGAAQAFFEPAASGLLPQTVPETMIQDATALTETSINLAFMLGPLLAVALVIGIGAGVAFAFDALTFAVSAVLLTRIQPRARGKKVAAQSLVADLRAGWREVASRTWVWVTIASFAGAVLCVYAQWYALGPSIARSVYGSTGVFGVLEAVGGGGAVLGAALAVVWRPARPLAVGLPLVFAWPAQNIAFAAGAPLPWVIALAFATGFGFALVTVWWVTALAYHIPPHALSRVTAWDWMGSLALLPLGYVIADPLAAWLGARTVLAAGSAVGLILIAMALVPRSTRSLRISID
jgi:MFS family permease